ncbi:MAG: TetR/AcrR family transcriptional regulator [Candidatus Gracilibacteria bacterium]|nr:TetR/AcrR family transcriptional regulator [Candidatus Gracilibacteria bacterium]
MKKEELLGKIEELFYEKTFKEISLDTIAKHLEIKKASLYYYFSSKETLIEALIDFSFENYKAFIEKISEGNTRNFVKEFIEFPAKNKNVFSIINQNGYCENSDMKKMLKTRQLEIFSIINSYFFENANFSKEKTFLLLSIMEDISKRKCIYGECPINTNDIVAEIYNTFNIV